MLSCASQVPPFSQLLTLIYPHKLILILVSSFGRMTNFYCVSTCPVFFSPAVPYKGSPRRQSWNDNDDNDSQHFHGIFSKLGTVLSALLMHPLDGVDAIGIPLYSSRRQGSLTTHTTSWEYRTLALELEMGSESQLLTYSFWAPPQISLCWALTSSSVKWG